VIPVEKQEIFLGFLLRFGFNKSEILLDLKRSIINRMQNCAPVVKTNGINNFKQKEGVNRDEA
jgi:hypothetical protein